MRRFMLTGGCLAGETVRLPDDEAAHAARVLRLKPGAPIGLIDGEGGMWEAHIEIVGAEGVFARVEAPAPDGEPPVRVTLYQGILKSDKFEWVVQKATELGVSRIVPLEMARCVAKWDGDKKIARLQKIAQEAAKQCGRARTPQIAPGLPFAKADFAAREVLIMPWEEARGTTLGDIHAQAPGAADIGIVIGPEGGITADEAHASRARLVTLGPRILRAETAAIASVALAMQLWGDI